MNVVHRLNETPCERLLYQERPSWLFCRVQGGPTNLIAIILLVILMTVIGIGGMLSTEIVQDCACRILKWALPEGW